MQLEEGETFFFAPRGLKNLVQADEIESLSPIISCQVCGVRLRGGGGSVAYGSSDGSIESGIYVNQNEYLDDANYSELPCVCMYVLYNYRT